MTTSIRCKFCGQIIYWIQINGKNLSFDDEVGSIPHRCVKMLRKVPELEIQSMVELLRSTILRLESYSDVIEELVKDYESRKKGNKTEI